MPLRMRDGTLHFGLNYSRFGGEYGLSFYGLPGWPSAYYNETALIIYYADSGPVTTLELQRDSAGTVVQSSYFYTGGTFTAHIYLEPWDPSLAEGVAGTFTASILTTEHQVHEDSGGVYSFFTLGAGLFDAPLARALGIGQRTKHGTMNAADPYNTLLYDASDHTWADRYADDGGLRITVTAPEPALGVLTLIAFAAVRLQPRRKGATS